MEYKVIFATASVERHFKKSIERIRSDGREVVMQAVEGLARNPRPHGVIKIVPPVVVYHLKAYYRIRVGDFRILYDIYDERRLVSVICLTKRDEKTYK